MRRQWFQDQRSESRSQLLLLLLLLLLLFQRFHFHQNSLLCLSVCLQLVFHLSRLDFLGSELVGKFSVLGGEQLLLPIVARKRRDGLGRRDKRDR